MTQIMEFFIRDSSFGNYPYDIQTGITAKISLDEDGYLVFDDYTSVQGKNNCKVLACIEYLEKRLVSEK